MFLCFSFSSVLLLYLLCVFCRCNGEFQRHGRHPLGRCDFEDFCQRATWASADLSALQRHCQLCLYVPTIKTNLRKKYRTSHTSSDSQCCSVCFSCACWQPGNGDEDIDWVTARRKLCITAIPHHIPGAGTTDTPENPSDFYIGVFFIKCACVCLGVS